MYSDYPSTFIYTAYQRRGDTLAFAFDVNNNGILDSFSGVTRSITPTSGTIRVNDQRHLMDGHSESLMDRMDSTGRWNVIF